MSKIRILIVDDSLIMRKMLGVQLSKEPDFEIVGAAANGAEALRLVSELKPDVVTLDVIMPGMGGMEVLKRLLALDRRVRVVMFSVLTLDGAQATVEALQLGAADFVAKPSRLSDAADSMSTISDQLVPKIRALAPAAPYAVGVHKTAPGSSPGLPARRNPRVVVVAVSTGGPEVLSTLIPALPKTFGLPMLVVQHMPPMFVRHLAARLATQGALPVRVASDGDLLEAGVVLFCPGGHHLTVERDGQQVRVRLNTDAPVNGCRPSADVLIESICRVYGGEAAAAVLTGMGNDGAAGCKKLYSMGGRILAQDAVSSVVWGMPGAVVKAGVAHKVLDPAGIAAELTRLAMLPH